MGKDWRDLQIERADALLAAPFRANIKEKYKACLTSQQLLALSKECWKAHNHAIKQANKYCNFSAHGTHFYDAWNYLADDAKAFAMQLFQKAKSA